MLSLTNGGMANECRLPDGSPRESSALLLEWMESAGHGEIAARTSAAAKASAMESFTFLLDPLSFRPHPRRPPPASTAGQRMGAHLGRG